MPDKKLTDSEIIKALEEHYKQVDKGYSDHLAYGGKGDEHEEKYIDMLSSVFDLINRLQAENERLKAEIKFSDYLEYETTNQIKAEAYKEFAERLKEWFCKESEVYKLIDNLLKEMVGEDNA